MMTREKRKELQERLHDIRRTAAARERRTSAGFVERDSRDVEIEELAMILSEVLDRIPGESQ